MSKEEISNRLRDIGNGLHGLANDADYILAELDAARGRGERPETMTDPENRLKMWDSAIGFVPEFSLRYEVEDGDIRFRGIAVGDEVFDRLDIPVDFFRFARHARTEWPKATAAIRAVLDLHEAVEWSFGYGTVKSCRNCSENATPEQYVEWPCATVRALEGSVE